MRRYHTGRDNDGLPVRRFTYECIEACHLGTDDPEEFAEHLTECPDIFPQLRELFARKRAAGVAIVVPRRRIGERPGQLELNA